MARESATTTRREQALLDLMANYQAGMTRTAMRVWLRELEPWSDEQIEQGVRRCVRDRSRTFAPKGVSEFMPYLASLVPSAYTGGHWSADGSWGGDWSRALSPRVLLAACVMSAIGMRRNREQIAAMVELAKERGYTQEQIDQGARLYLQAGTIDQWLRDQKPAFEGDQTAMEIG